MGRSVAEREQGAAMVELAIILPLLLVVLFAVMELGFILYDKALITNASREGARAGIVYRANVTTGEYQPYTAAEIQGVVNAYLNHGNNLIPPAQPAITMPGGVCTGTAFPLRVRVVSSYAFFLLPNLVTSITGPLTLSGESVMRCE